jgi:hypothetical protein
MNIEVLKKIENIEKITYREIESYIINFSLIVTIKKFMLIAIDETLPKNSNSFGLQFYLINTANNKEIEFRFAYNVRLEGNFFNKDFYVRYDNKAINNSVRNSFRLKDYCTFRKIDFPEGVEQSFHISNEDRLKIHIIKYILFVKDVLATEEMQKILFTDYWVNVPIDFSPYK